MTRRIEALYEEGLLRPLEPLDGVAEHSRLTITLELKDRGVHPLAELVGTMPDEDAEEMMQIINEEFERVDAEEWK
jgi:predicted DNA-binding antitoxin AbrB/MazE fold protein